MTTATDTATDTAQTDTATDTAQTAPTPAPAPALTRRVVRRDNERDLAFVGRLVASVADPRRGRHQNRWTELSLWETARGRYVISRVARTCWQGEEDGYTAATANDAAGVVEALEGLHGGELTDLAKRLLLAARLDEEPYVEVDEEA